MTNNFLFFIQLQHRYSKVVLAYDGSMPHIFMGCINRRIRLFQVSDHQIYTGCLAFAVSQFISNDDVSRIRKKRG